MDENRRCLSEKLACAPSDDVGMAPALGSKQCPARTARGTGAWQTGGARHGGQRAEMVVEGGKKELWESGAKQRPVVPRQNSAPTRSSSNHVEPMGGPFLLAALAVFLVVLVARADSDVVVGNTDTTDIVYSPQTSWIESTSDPFFASGTSMRTNDPNAKATLTFIGTAIYFWAPLWPSRVSTALSLDGAPPSLVDLRDHTQPPDETSGPTVASAPVWFAANLEDTTHTLVISVGVGQTVAVVDQLVYTLSDTDPPPSTSDAETATPTDTDITPSPSSLSSSSTSSSFSLLPTPSPSAATSSASSNTPGLSIAIGIVVALFACLGLGSLFWWWRRRVRRRRLRAEESALHPPLPDMNETSTQNAASLGRTRSARYRDIAAYFGTNDYAGPFNPVRAGGKGPGSRSSRRNAPPPPVPRRKPPPPGKSNPRRSLGTIPEVHPRDVLVEDEDNSTMPDWAEVRLVPNAGQSTGRAGSAVDRDREDPWFIRDS